MVFPFYLISNIRYASQVKHYMFFSDEIDTIIVISDAMLHLA